MIKYSRVIKRMNVAIFLLLILVTYGSEAVKRSAFAYNSLSCPSVQNEPTAICPDRIVEDTGYYGCSSSDTETCCVYDSASVKCYNALTHKYSDYLGTEQVLMATSHTSHCFGGKCIVSINS